MRYLIIDGYNAIGRIDALEAKKDLSLEAARLNFIKMLNDFMERKDIFDKIFIVFDSKQEALGIRRHNYGAIEVRFATKDKDADGVIVDMLKKASSNDLITISSDDNFVRNHARAFGRDIMSISELKNIIILKKKTLESKIERRKGIEQDKIKDINEELKRRWGIE